MRLIPDLRCTFAGRAFNNRGERVPGAPLDIWQADPASSLITIGLIEFVCLALYLIPLGAVLWTGYLGGAIASHLRLGNPLFSHTLFPIYVAAMLWGGLWLRDSRGRTSCGNRGLSSVLP